MGSSVPVAAVKHLPSRSRKASVVEGVMIVRDWEQASEGRWMSANPRSVT